MKRGLALAALLALPPIIQASDAYVDEVLKALEKKGLLSAQEVQDIKLNARKAERQAARRRTQKAKDKARETADDVAELAGAVSGDLRRGLEDAATSARDAAASALDAFRPPQSEPGAGDDAG